MAHVGVFCPPAPGHLNPMLGLAHGVRVRGHRVTLPLLVEPSPAPTVAGFEIIPLGGGDPCGG